MSWKKRFGQASWELFAGVLVFFICSLVISLYQHGSVMPGLFGGDFKVYYGAAQHYLNGGYVYDLSAVAPPGKTYFQYLYLPAYLLLFLPFTVLSFDIAYGAFLLFSTVSMVVALLYLWLDQGLPVKPWVGGLSIVGILLYQPVVQSLRLGQIIPLLAAAIALSIVWHERQSVASGIVTAMTAWVKPFYLPLGAWSLNSARGLVGLAIGTAAVFGTSYALMGVSGLAGWYGKLSAGKGWVTFRHPIQQWAAGYYEPFSWLGQAPAIAIKVSLLVGLLWVTWRWRQQDNPDPQAMTACAVVAVPLVAPEIYATAFVVMLPAIIVLVARSGRWWSMLACLLAFSANAAVVQFVSEQTAHIPTIVLAQPALYANLWLFAHAAGVTLNTDRAQVHRNE